MSKKKKVSRGNPAAIAEPKTRGGWKPSTSLGNTSTIVKPQAKIASRPKPKKFNWKQWSAVLIVLFVGAALIVSSVAVPSPEPEAPSLYNPQPVTQGSSG